jgi:hypothetical protein
MLAAYFGLRIKYVGGLSPKVAGFMIAKTIVINANKSKSDHAFTIAHEIGHYHLHCKQNYQMPFPRILKRQWKAKRMIRFSKLLNRVLARQFNTENQADLWAFCALFYIGARDDVLAVLEQHPEKATLFWLSVVGCIRANIQRRLKAAARDMFYFINVLTRVGT